MNPYYQFFLASGGELEATTTPVSEPLSEPLGTGIASGGVVGSPVSSPVSSGGAVQAPVVEPLGTGTASGSPLSPVSSPEPTTTLGGGSTSAPAGTTINIFGTGTSATTGAGQVAVDTNTGLFATDTTDPNAALSPPILGGGGGGFGGGGGGGEDEGGVAGAAPRLRTIIPLIVIAAGIAVFIFKPFKK